MLNIFQVVRKEETSFRKISLRLSHWQVLGRDRMVLNYRSDGHVFPKMVRAHELGYISQLSTTSIPYHSGLLA